MKVYHGGTRFNKEFKRTFEAVNGGNLGYYVTTSKEQAQGYGKVYEYTLKLENDAENYLLTYKEAEKLSKLTRLYDCYDGDPSNLAAIASLRNGETLYSAVLECINSTGEIDKSIKFMLSLGCNYASTDDPDVLIAFDGLTENK